MDTSKTGEKLRARRRYPHRVPGMVDDVTLQAVRELAEADGRTPTQWVRQLVMREVARMSESEQG